MATATLNTEVVVGITAAVNGCDPLTLGTATLTVPVDAVLSGDRADVSVIVDTSSLGVGIAKALRHMADTIEANWAEADE